MREHEVLLFLVQGQSNKEMARELGVSPKAIEIYRSKLMTKMAAQSLPGLLGEGAVLPRTAKQAAALPRLPRRQRGLPSGDEAA